MSHDPKTVGDTAPARLSTQVVVALLGLLGVLGAALIANWDKVFGGRQPAATARPASIVAAAPTPASSVPAAAASSPTSLGGSTSGAQSPIVNSGGGSVTINIAPPAPASAATPARPPADISSRLVGTWITPVAQNPYSASHPFRLRLRFERFGDQLIGTATDIRADATDGHARDMLDLKVDGRTASFSTAGSTVGSGGAHVPYQTTYRLELDDSTLRITRRNNVSTGGVMERFEARRDPADPDTGKASRP